MKTKEQRECNRDFAYKQMLITEHIAQSLSKEVSLETVMKNTQQYSILADRCDRKVRETIWEEFLLVSGRPPRRVTDIPSFTDLFEKWTFQGNAVNLYAIEQLHTAFVNTIRCYPHLYDVMMSKNNNNNNNPQLRTSDTTSLDIPASLWGNDLPAALQQLALVCVSPTTTDTYTPIRTTFSHLPPLFFFIFLSEIFFYCPSYPRSSRPLPQRLCCFYILLIF